MIVVWLVVVIMYVVFVVELFGLVLQILLTVILSCLLSNHSKKCTTFIKPVRIKRPL